MATNDDEAKVLTQWYQRLSQELQIGTLDVDPELLLELARKSADSVIHASAPVTTFLVGYAAGLEAGGGTAGSATGSNTAGIAKSADVAFRLCEEAAAGKGGTDLPG